MSNKLRCINFLVAAILIIGSQANASYMVIEIGGGYSAPYGVNDAGLIVGGSTPIPGVIATQATLWSGNATTYLDTLGGRGATAYAINNVGQVVGSAFTINDAMHATLWNGTTATDLGTLGSRGDSVATAVNDTGQAVGYSYNSPEYYLGYFHAVLWNGTTAIDLGTGGRDSSLALGINNVGQVVGYAYDDGGLGRYSKAMLWDGTSAIELDTQGKGGRATAINEAGQVVGMASCWDCPDSEFYATMWDGDVRINLGSLGISSMASALNDVGQVVGSSLLPGIGFHATLWSGTAMIDLNDALNTPEAWVLVSATGINNEGWIVAQGYNRNLSTQHAFLLIPNVLPEAAPINAVPEPNSSGILLAGFGFLGWRLHKLG